jgi:hypothetical protein
LFFCFHKNKPPFPAFGKEKEAFMPMKNGKKFFYLTKRDAKYGPQHTAFVRSATPRPIGTSRPHFYSSFVVFYVISITLYRFFVK